MTQASREFIHVVKENQRLELPLIVKIIIGGLVAVSVFYFAMSLHYLLDDVYQWKRILMATLIYLVISGILIFFLYKQTQKQLATQTYESEIRNGIVAGVKRGMEQCQLPLDLVGKMLREDIQAELERIQGETRRYVDFIKKVWVGIVCTPCAFLLTLLFQALFDKNSLSTDKNWNDAINLLLVIFALLVIIAVIVTVIYQIVCDGWKVYSGEKRLLDCLDMLKEIQINDLYCAQKPTEDKQGDTRERKQKRTREKRIKKK